MASLEMRARGQNKFVAIIAYLSLCACQTQVTKPVAFYDATKVSVHAKGGITTINGVPISGIIFSLNERGDTTFVIPYLNGKEHGISRHYYDNGQQKSVRFTNNGWKEKEHVGWFENGQKQFVYHFKNDMFDGNQKEWLVNGMLYSDLNYKEGKEYGSQKVWNKNGKIKTNYIIKNNRRYGLLGTKNCVNASDRVNDSLQFSALFLFEN